jgi:Holliday junction resolvasome RuvABC endonuclease subunit
VILHLQRIPQPDHAADALAVAITHTHHNGEALQAAKDRPPGVRPAGRP